MTLDPARAARLLLALSFLLPAAVAAAADAAAGANAGASRAVPSVAAVAIDGEQSPVIDGDLSDAVWSRANVFDNLVQTDPQPFGVPSERTEVRVLYDRNKLYVAFHAFDRRPDRIAISTMERDAALRSDDVVRILLDPRLTGRDGYFFELNAAGSRLDALVIGGGGGFSLEESWNMLWEGNSRRVADGWTAEFALPFRGLSYDPDSDTWGFDVSRQIRHMNESLRWSPGPPGTRVIDASYAGRLTGLRGMTQGKGLDVLVYGQARATRDWAAGDTTVTGRPSATAYYRFTPALTGLLTANTDFTDKPLDSRQVNTTRFSLFEPETREFFLEDADAFEFGSFGNRQAANGRPFFTRNIGLVRGRTVNLDFGAKLSGSLGPLRVGALSVRTGSDGLTPAQTLSVARVTGEVLSESRLGVIATHGDPTGLTRNNVVGADFHYRNSNLVAGKRLEGAVYIERSASSSVGNGVAFGGELSYPNEPWDLSVKFKQIGEQFKPALGFVNRPGIREYDASVDRIWRFKFDKLQKATLGGSLYLVNDLHDRLQSREDSLSLNLVGRRNDQLEFEVDRFVEVLTAPFDLPGGLVVPAGRYSFARWTGRIQTAPSRPFSVEFKVTCCDYYNGRSTETELQLSWHPSPHFTTSFSHELQPIDLPDGRTSIHIESLGLTANFTPDMKLVTEAQYDNVSRRFGASMRYRWEMRPGTELLVTLGESAILTGAVPHGAYRSEATAIAVRLGHRFQF